MTDKEMVKKLTDDAEISWVACGYYDLIGKKFSNKSNTRKRDFITIHDILDITYQGETIQLGITEIKVGTLGSDISLPKKN